MRAAILAAAAVLPALAAGEAWALFDGRLRPYVSATINHDDNILRLSDNPFPEQDLTGEGRRGGDTYFVTALGVRFDIPYGSHRFHGDVQANDERYRRFKELDFRGHDAKAQWEWKVEGRWLSRVGYNDLEKLGEFSDLPVALRVKNPLRVREGYGEANWQPTGVWRLRGYVSEREQRNTDTLLRQNDVDVRTYDASAHYPVAATGWLGAGYRLERGRYPQREFVAGGLFDNAYEQRHPYVIGERDLFGHSRVSLRAGPIEREYANRPERNVKDTAFRAVYDWKPTVKTSLQFVAIREISVVEEVATNFVRVRGFSVRPEWRVTEKTTVFGLYDHSLRDYLGDSGFRPETPLPDRSRRDRLRIVSVGVQWNPTEQLFFLASASHERRASTFELGDYTAVLFSLQGRLTF